MIKKFLKILLLISMFSEIFLLSSCNNNTKEEVFDELNKKIEIAKNNNDQNKHDTDTKKHDTNKNTDKINKNKSETKNKPK